VLFMSLRCAAGLTRGAYPGQGAVSLLCWSPYHPELRTVQSASPGTPHTLSFQMISPRCITGYVRYILFPPGGALSAPQGVF